MARELQEQRPRWQQITILFVCIAGIAGILGLLVVLIGGYYYGWTWAGLYDYVYTKPDGEIEFQRGKTFWDWMDLLIAPLILAIGTAAITWFTRERRNEEVVAARQAQHEREIHSDTLREASLQAYIDRMSELLIDRALRSSDSQSEQRSIVRARTLSVLRGLDGTRKGIIVKFLFDSQLISKDQPIITLALADLTQANLANVTLIRAALQGVKLNNANLEAADLTETNLRETNLREANLQGANLQGAKFQWVNLQSATITRAQLVTCLSLQGAILPDGTKVPDDQDFPDGWQ